MHTAQNFRILYKVDQRLSLHNLIISKYHKYSKAPSKKNDSNKTCGYVHDLSIYKTSLV
jgi:hypothetical protein